MKYGYTCCSKRSDPSSDRCGGFPAQEATGKGVWKSNAM
jgi:hypothetical protein